MEGFYTLSSMFSFLNFEAMCTYTFGLNEHAYYIVDDLFYKIMCCLWIYQMSRDHGYWTCIKPGKHGDILVCHLLQNLRVSSSNLDED